jgi:hypothetical protein
MNAINKRKNNVKTLDPHNNINNIYLKNEKNRTTYSSSQKNLKLCPKELMNKFEDDPLDMAGFKTSKNCRIKKIIIDRNKKFYLNNSPTSELYQEEINYNIDTTKNYHDTTDSSKVKVKNEVENDEATNDFYFYDNNQTFKQKDYWLEEKNKYIQELEKKIQSQENIISNLYQFKNNLNDKIQNENDINGTNTIIINNSNFSSSENDINNNIDKKLYKKLSFKDVKNRTYMHNFNNDIEPDKCNENKKVYYSKGKNQNDKYNILYSKYLQLSNDFKYLSHSNSLNEKNQIKRNFMKLQQEYSLLKLRIVEKDKIIEKQKKEIEELKKNKDNSNCKIQYILGGEEEKEVIKNLKKQVEVFRKDLVLSQAMVNSLKSEIEQLNKDKNNSAININYCSTNSNSKTNNTLDKNLFTFNENTRQSLPITPQSQFAQTINYNESINFNNPQSLVNSLKNKDNLLTKILEENNELRKRLKNFDSVLPEFNVMNDKKEEMKLKTFKKFEENFKYFNEYIKRMKVNIQKIYKDIPNIFNKYINKVENRVLSDEFIFNLYELRKEYNNIKQIDLYNLDITDDEKCIKIYKKINKLLSEECEKIMKNRNTEKERNQEYLFDTKNINDLNNTIQSNILQKNISNSNSLIDLVRPNKYNSNNDLFSDNIETKMEYDYKNRKTRRSIKMIPNNKYNFKYGKNFDDINYLEKNYETIFNKV